MSDFDFVIVGAGMAGASIAATLAPRHSVLILEAEAQPGYHATGRSVAFWTESYGGPTVQPLTRASGAFLASPPAEFSATAFLKPRGALHIGRAGQEHLANAMVAEFDTSGLCFERLGHEEMVQQIPGLRAGWDVGLYERQCSDIDVARLHAAYLRAASRDGAKLACNARLTEARFNDGKWQLASTAGNFTARTMVNAAGAWADQLAKLCGIPPLEIQPFRRTVVQLQVEPAPPSDLPLVIALDGSFYFKPEPGGRLWLSPHDEIPSPACDAAPEEIDVALAIDRFEKTVAWDIVKLEHKWAGLRSFAPDRLPVVGPDGSNPQFFWAAGQGGFGIQTAPAIAQLAGAQLCDDISAPNGIDIDAYLPSRVRTH